MNMKFHTLRPSKLNIYRPRDNFNLLNPSVMLQRLDGKNRLSEANEMLVAQSIYMFKGLKQSKLRAPLELVSTQKSQKEVRTMSFN